MIVLGASLNGLAIALNGRMPYDPAAVAGVGLRPGIETPKNEPADGQTRLGFLGDTVPVAPLRKVVSPGDILISAGATALVALAMRRRPSGAAPTAPIAEEVNHDPDADLEADRPDDLHAGGPRDAALHGGRAGNRGQLTGSDPFGTACGR